mmetsp:Transcript_60112/g.69643  ORF Transcript_60112/g.69643 Transcript_60112/m.69643 type:complete len:713 (-) Transcript_60112:170-2308(-)
MSNTKSTKDEKYEKMLQSIGMKTDHMEQEDKDHEESHEKPQDGQISINDLIFNVEKNVEGTNAAGLKAQAKSLNKKAVLNEALNSQKQMEIERKTNSKIIRKDIGKWNDVIRRNRGAEHIDFTKNKPKDNFRITAKEGKAKNPSLLESKMEEKLKDLNMFDEQEYLKAEKEQLKQLDTKEYKERMKELAKNRSLLFYQELKNRRVSKIKSKLYHKIRNKREKKLQEKLMATLEQMDPSLKLKHLEDLEKKRAEERVSLRHRNKSKYAKSLLRFGTDKKDAQASMNELAELRQEIKKKLNPEVRKRIEGHLKEDDQLLLNLPDEEFKDAIVKQLEAELLEDEDEKSKKKKAPGFLQKLLLKSQDNSQQQANELLRKIKDSENLEDISIDEEDEEKGSEGEEKDIGEQIDEDWGDAEPKPKKKVQKESLQSKETFSGRQKFVSENDKREDDKGVKPSTSTKKPLNNPKKVLQEFIEVEGDGTNDPQTEGLQSNKIIAESNKANKSAGKGAKGKQNENKNPLEGLNLENVKQKYKKQLDVDFKEQELKDFDEENNKELYENINNFNIVTANKGDEEFKQEKDALLENKLEPEGKALKGWGSWTGLGVKEPRKDPKAEALKKIQQIEALKKKRADGDLDHVIIHEERNKLVTKYLIPSLPHPFSNSKQFDYLQSVPLGPDWNNLRTQQKLTKPKIITKAGEIIAPIQPPKAMKKKA